MAFLDTTGLERLWQHIVSKISGKADIDHSHTIEEIGAASAENARKTFFSIASGASSSIAFSGETQAMIYCRGWNGNLAAVFNYSGYAGGDNRQGLTTFVNHGGVSAGINNEASGQGITITNNGAAALSVCVDLMFGADPVVTSGSKTSSVSNTVSYLTTSGGTIAGQLNLISDSYNEHTFKRNNVTTKFYSNGTNDFYIDNTTALGNQTIRLHGDSILSSSYIVSGNASVGTSALRNIQAGTSALTSGSSSLTTGVIYFQYE